MRLQPGLPPPSLLDVEGEWLSSTCPWSIPDSERTGFPSHLKADTRLFLGPPPRSWLRSFSPNVSAFPLLQGDGNASCSRTEPVGQAGNRHWESHTGSW